MRRQESHHKYEKVYKTNHQYYVYIITNKKDGVLYIGITNNLERRIFEHKNKLVKGFSSKYNLDKLIYFETHQLVDEAIKREKNMKKWKREWKINFILEENPDWNDLSKNWFN
ncbi:GIY-YIG nuclease family protein [Tenacibaculum sp. IB213877]|uniref:GIY-YIG nuclease family protein n=1 Tax=Tenacibaculum sp. IB213877 TaxID=3097351 RepID=UPI002A5A450C|nr:GIY-YIG nuclease family protein [Tenacibaculum sp. IB213877]MDY0779235.1 GIY-YIG nuclease family protein [Tenacibaculum sp. IB213877]